MRRLLFVCILSFFALVTTYSQNNNEYRIALSIPQLRDSTLYLAYHLGDKQYIRDSVLLDERGNGVFSGDELLPQGIYMIVVPGKRYFEVLMPEDQLFSVECSYPDYQNTLKFEGSPENQAFLEYQRRWLALQKEATAIASRIKNNQSNQDSLPLLNALMSDKESEMKRYLHKVADDNSSSVLSLLVRSTIPIEIPDFVVPSGTNNPDSVRWYLRYNYNKDHFFDNIDLTDSRMLRTPILHSRLDVFFKNVVIQSPDSINKEIDKIISKCESNHDVFQYVAVFLFNHFRVSEIMGHDAVIVKLADDIYLSGKADWVSEEFKKDLSRQVELLRNNLIGLSAKDLVMDSYKGIFVSLYDIEKDFTILYFWEPNCSHCKIATPKLKEVYGKIKDEGVEVFAVCTTDDKEEWSNYIKNNNIEWINGWDPERKSHFDYYYNIQSTPIVYILDREKKIIAKKISVDDIESFIDTYRSLNYR